MKAAKLLFICIVGIASISQASADTCETVVQSRLSKLGDALLQQSLQELNSLAYFLDSCVLMIEPGNPNSLREKTTFTVTASYRERLGQPDFKTARYQLSVVFSSHDRGDEIENFNLIRN